MARMTGFVFQDDYLEKTARLSDQELGRLVRALATYHATGEAQELAGRECGYFDFIRADIDRIDEKYEARCQTNRNNRQRTITNDDDGQRSLTMVYKVKDKDIYNNDTAHAREESSVGTVTVDPLIVKTQQELNGLTDTHYAALNDYRDALSDDVVSYAIDLAVGNGVRNWSYVEFILRKWVKAGVKTLGEAKAENEKHKQQPRQQPKLLRSQQYEQRDWKESEMAEKLGVDDLFKAGAG